MTEKISPQGTSQPIEKLIVYIGERYESNAKWSEDTCRRLCLKLTDETLDKVFIACYRERKVRKLIPKYEEEYL